MIQVQNVLALIISLGRPDCSTTNVDLTILQGCGSSSLLGILLRKYTTGNLLQNLSIWFSRDFEFHVPRNALEAAVVKQEQEMPTAPFFGLGKGISVKVG
ncbi:hypothetical protein [Chamaesiphon sp. VAR_48_metabat_135_sub]|uniref:hypothetical protein n=1 Tax=Chamaesiphon sp. VAR_48_metabat_135_sub TaxID=2964699 RepID=UPI00286A63E2|nr:hypothetical protein [Chamaesiphon sp. VAR_48_metabat_135_sub]